MLDFQSLTLSDYDAVCTCFEADVRHRRTCDYTVGTTFMWRHFFDTAYTIADETLLLRARYFDGGEMYTFPIGKDPVRAIESLREDCHARGRDARFCFAVAEDIPVLQDVFDTVEILPVPDWADYLYERATFVSLTGKKYHGQRNFVNRFRKLYPQAQLVPITEENTASARQFVLDQYARFPDDTSMAKAEHAAILEVLAHYNVYRMRGAMLSADGQIVGITLGEVIRDTLYVHVEKADTTYSGVYPMLATAFAASVTDPAVLYINREEDMGDAGLRRSKQSWHPLHLIPKYTVICR